MRYFNFLLLLYFLIKTNYFQAQNWFSLAKIDYYNCTPTNQFIINPYTNDLWFVSDLKVAVLKSSGSHVEYGNNELGSLWSGDNLNFGFSPNNTYFSKLMEGLFSFNNDVRNLVLNSTEINAITTNNDTVYTMSGTQNMYKYTPTSTIDAMYGLSNVKAKNQFLYLNAGVIGRKIGLSTVYLYNDPEYLIATVNDYKFSRKSDTLFVASKKGISYAYNYDFLDTITPNNSINMPGPNVLEIEFDNNDNLWAVFGDSNDVPFAISKLEGNTWTSRFDNTNSPIDFSHFYGLEIDTLGNLWVADLNYLHTFLTPNSPTWLGTKEMPQSFHLNIFPNPSSDHITISEIPLSLIGSNATITDLNGKQILDFEITQQQEQIDCSSMKKGVYFLRIGEENQKFIIE
jgi:hypothetical protein